MTKEEKDAYVSLLQEKIQFKKLELELQELNTRFAKLRAEEIGAVEFIASKTQIPKNVEYELTQEDLDENPELIEQGFKVGQTIVISEEDAKRAKQRTEEEQPIKQQSPKGLKKV